MDMVTCINVSSDTIWFLPFSSPKASWRFFPYQVRFTFLILSPFPCQTLSGPKCIALNLGSPLGVSTGPISRNCKNPLLRDLRQQPFELLRLMLTACNHRMNIATLSCSKLHTGMTHTQYDTKWLPQTTNSLLRNPSTFCNRLLSQKIELTVSKLDRCLWPAAHPLRPWTQWPR